MRKIWLTTRKIYFYDSINKFIKLSYYIILYNYLSSLFSQLSESINIYSPISSTSPILYFFSSFSSILLSILSSYLLLFYLFFIFLLVISSSSSDVSYKCSKFGLTLSFNSISFSLLSSNSLISNGTSSYYVNL